MNGCPHGHVCGVFGGSHPYLRCNLSLSSDLLKEKLYFFKGSTLSQFDAPLCVARFIVIFSLMSSFPFLPFLMFCFSVLMFLFIRVCSVSAISVSLFSNGSQMTRDHS